jgi:predicted metal-dependent peptidase
MFKELDSGLCLFFGGIYQPDSDTIYLSPLLFQQFNQSELISVLAHEIEHMMYHAMQQCGILTEKEQTFCDWYLDWDGNEQTEWLWTYCRDLFDDEVIN